MKEIKNTDGDNTMGIYKDGIVIKGELKIQEQEHETEVINYLPSANIKCNLAPEFIEQITKEVIKKMKEDHINFAEVKQPCKAIAMNTNKITSNAGSSVIMDEKGVVTAKVGDTSVTTIKEGIIGKVDNEISNTEDIESNKEKGPETSPITVNIKIPEIIQELINSYVESLETMSKAMKEAEEKANCEIEALKGEVNLLKVENNKLKKQEQRIETENFLDYLNKEKIELENIMNEIKSKDDEMTLREQSAKNTAEISIEMIDTIKGNVDRLKKYRELVREKYKK